MSLEVIEAEIRRFLSSSNEEVLCIKGKWGVGKTFGWRRFLRAAKESKSLAMQRYAYVSLFGLNSLDELRYSLFENTVTGDNIGTEPDTKTFEQLIKDGDNVRKLRPLADLAAAFFNRKGLTDLLAKSAFLSVRSQLICFDDLERAGRGLEVRDVLGLASLLKEQRKCKIVLLLNDQEHDQKEEFERQLEKVADVTLIFDLTPTEAVTIALNGNSTATELLKPRIIELGLNNIRVIKKIERLAIRLVDILSTRFPSLLEESVATLALASWSVQQPKTAPTLSFIKTYNSLTFAMRERREPADPEIERFRSSIKNYPFNSANALDQVIIDCAVSGYFKESLLIEAADLIAAERKARGHHNEFSRVWQELYHGSLAVEDDAFLDALYKSAISEADSISPLNINGTIRMLREAGRSGQADEVIAAYIAAHNDEHIAFFNIGTHHFSAEDNLDDGLRDAFSARRAAHIDLRDPLEVLRKIGENSGWDEADVALLAKQGAKDFELMFESLRGKELRASIDMIRLIGQSHKEGTDAINTASIDALRQIASKSPLRARKVLQYGFPIK